MQAYNDSQMLRHEVRGICAGDAESMQLEFVHCGNFPQRGSYQVPSSGGFGIGVVENEKKLRKEKEEAFMPCAALSTKRFECRRGNNRLLSVPFRSWLGSGKYDFLLITKQKMFTSSIVGQGSNA